MFEFHGWITLRVDENEWEDTSERRAREDRAMEQVREAIEKYDDSFYDVRRSSNGIVVIMAHGLRNHRYNPVISLFHWVSENYPQSYGLLYVHDDEAAGHQNEFRVWRLALGKLTEQADSLLSPYQPTVERP